MEAVVASLEATLDSSIIQGRADCVVPVCMTLSLTSRLDKGKIVSHLRFTIKQTSKKARTVLLPYRLKWFGQEF